jgi:predicted ATP-dependent protease
MKDLLQLDFKLLDLISVQRFSIHHLVEHHYQQLRMLLNVEYDEIFHLHEPARFQIRIYGYRMSQQMDTSELIVYNSTG